MLKDIMRAFQAPDPSPLAVDDVRLALAALLVRVARTDGDYSEHEADVILHLLEQEYALSESEALALRSEAETLEAKAPDTVRFTRVIKDVVPYEERRRTVAVLWAVVLADGERDHEEDGFMRLAANLLGVNDRDSALARQSVRIE